MKRTILAAALASALILSGCGNNEDEQAKTAITNYFTHQSGQQAPMKKKDATCLADGMVKGIGVDQLKKYHVLKEDASFNKNIKNFKMSKDDSQTLADTFMKCTNVVETMKTQAAASPAGQTPEGKQCFEATLTEDKVRAMLVASFSGDRQQATQFQSELMKCASAGAPTPPAPSGSPAPKR